MKYAGVWIVVAASLCMAACKEDKPTFTKGESEAALKEIDALHQSLVGVDCSRPPLRGTPTAGSGQEQARKLLDKSNDEVKSCLATVNSIVFPPPSRDTAPKRFSLGMDEGERYAEVTQSCESSFEALQRSVAYSELCIVKVEDDPIDDEVLDRGMSVMEWSTAVGVEARVRCAKGQCFAAAELLLDYLRFVQDFARGRASFLEEMLYSSAMDRVFGHLTQLVLKETSLGTGEKAELARQLRVLLDSAPHASEYAPGEAARLAKSNLKLSKKTSALSESLVVLAAHKLRKTLCGEKSSYWACAAAVRNWAAGGKVRAADMQRDELLPPLKDDALKKEIAGMFGSFVETLPKYYDRTGNSVAALIALEAALRSTHETCPGKPRIAPLGEELLVEKKDNLVAFSRKLASGSKEGEPLLEFMCPAKPAHD